LTAPALVFPTAWPYVLSARVTISFRDTFDAGVLVAYQNDDTWAKLCFEYSPQKRPMIVSVVTRSLSDDCTSVEIEQSWVYLRIAKINAAFVLHYSLDGSYWHFVRLFALGPAEAATSSGFLVQSPQGTGVTARFSDFSYEQRELTDIRSGV
jgi:regulation of enolase protein 1 (concanavalin A-like superfamily)